MPARLLCWLVLQLLLLLLAAGCGDDERGASPGGPDEPVSAPAGSGSGSGEKPASARSCRRLGHRLVGSTLPAATERATRRRCTLRVAVLDGRGLALTEDYQTARINVAVRDDVITGVEFMG